MPEAKATCCESCGEELDDEELESPYKEDGQIICDECHHDNYEYTCCLCEQYEHVKFQHKLLVVFDDDVDGASPGVYRILAGPYYIAPLIGEGRLCEDKLARISHLTRDLIPAAIHNFYPCGHLCQKCQKKFKGKRRLKTKVQ